LLHQSFLWGVVLHAVKTYSREPYNQQLLLTALEIVEAARALRARATICCNAPQQNCSRYTASALR